MDTSTKIQQHAVPDRIGKYRVDAIIGQGATGVVYRAFDTVLQQVVALKTLRGELLGKRQHAELVARFRNEVQASGRLAHPNLVSVHEYGESEGIAYIAMALIEGAPLAAFLMPEQPTELSCVMRWMTQLLEGLAYVHDCGVVHRDIKPSNLLVTTTNDIKITDFGIAWIESSPVSQVASLSGTPSYMSPEQVRGEVVDGRSDLFSSAIVLYQLLTGVRPFSGDAAVVMRQIVQDDVAVPSRRNAGLGCSFDQVLATALAKEPIHRFATARQFLDALTQAFHNRHVDHPATQVQAALANGSDPMRDDQIGAAHVGDPMQPSVRTSSAGVACSDDSDINSQTKMDLFVQLAATLSRQVGPIAVPLLEKACACAHNLDELQSMLMAYIPSEAGKVEFSKKIEAMRCHRILFDTADRADFSRLFPISASALLTDYITPGPSDMAIAADFSEAVEKALTRYLGADAPSAVERALVKSTGKNSFVALVSESILSAQDKKHFFDDVRYL
jgi:serine/threonine protein kinase